MSQDLYDLPAGWEWKRLGDIVEFRNGFAFKSTDFSDIGIPILRISNIQDGNITEDRLVFYPEAIMHSDFNRYFVEDGEIVIAMSGATTGKVAINKSKKRWLQNQRVGRFVIACNSLKIYLYYFLSSVVKENLNKALGAAQPNLSTLQINEINIPLPPLAEQTRIVEKLDAVLSRIDTAIDELQQSLALVDAMFKSGLDQAFNPLGSPSNEEGLYDLPEGWGWKTLNDIALKITDGTHHSPKVQYDDWAEGRFKYLSSKHIKNDGMLLENVTYVDESVHEEIFARCNPEYEDQLLTKDGAMTGTCCLNELNEPFSLLSSVALIKQNREIIYPKYLNFYLQSKVGQDFLLSDISGAAITRTNLKKLKMIPVPVASLSLQVQIVDEIVQFQEKATQLKTELTAKIGMFNQLKASVLDGAFRGEL